MPFTLRVQTLIYLACLLCFCTHAHAQLPFYTDDTGITDRGRWHFEFFNEYDALQLQYPNVRQNTANFKLNYGLPHHLEIDADIPYLTILRASGNPPSSGWGDLNMGIKWGFHEESDSSRMPSLAASLYIEAPTGNSQQQLGSGLADYWLNLIGQRSFSKKDRLTGNIGILFAGNTSTGALGTQNTRGQVYTGGISFLHDVNSKLTLGGELYGGYADHGELGRSQMQAMAGGQYALREGFDLCFGLLGGKYVASPQIGAQIGFAVDLPDIKLSAPRHNAFHSYPHDN